MKLWFHSRQLSNRRTNSSVQPPISKKLSDWRRNFPVWMSDRFLSSRFISCDRCEWTLTPEKQQKIVGTHNWFSSLEDQFRLIEQQVVLFLRRHYTGCPRTFITSRMVSRSWFSLLSKSSSRIPFSSQNITKISKTKCSIIYVKFVVDSFDHCLQDHCRSSK